MVNYKNGKIYTIRSHSTNKYYIGSSANTLTKRFNNHKDMYSYWINDNNYRYVSSYEIFKLGDAYIELLENYPCNDKNELRKREGELIRQYKNELVNMVIDGRTYKEWKEDNKEHLKEYEKNRYNNINRIELREKFKQKIKCECNAVISLIHKPRHIKTQKHINYLKSQNNIVI